MFFWRPKKYDYGNISNNSIFKKLDEDVTDRSIFDSFGEALSFEKLDQHITTSFFMNTNNSIERIDRVKE